MGLRGTWTSRGVAIDGDDMNAVADGRRLSGNHRGISRRSPYPDSGARPADRICPILDRRFSYCRARVGALR
jgi:hypothetical protein